MNEVFFLCEQYFRKETVFRAPGHAQSSVRGFTAIEEGQGRLPVLCNA